MRSSHSVSLVPKQQFCEVSKEKHSILLSLARGFYSFQPLCKVSVHVFDCSHCFGALFDNVPFSFVSVDDSQMIAAQSLAGVIACLLIGMVVVLPLFSQSFSLYSLRQTIRPSPSLNFVSYSLSFSSSPVPSPSPAPPPNSTPQEPPANASASPSPLPTLNRESASPPSLYAPLAAPNSFSTGQQQANGATSAVASPSPVPALIRDSASLPSLPAPHPSSTSTSHSSPSLPSTRSRTLQPIPRFCSSKCTCSLEVSGEKIACKGESETFLQNYHDYVRPFVFLLFRCFFSVINVSFLSFFRSVRNSFGILQIMRMVGNGKRIMKTTCGPILLLRSLHVYELDRLFMFELELCRTFGTPAILLFTIPLF